MTNNIIVYENCDIVKKPYTVDDKQNTPKCLSPPLPKFRLKMLGYGGPRYTQNSCGGVVKPLEGATNYYV